MPRPGSDSDVGHVTVSLGLGPGLKNFKLSESSLSPGHSESGGPPSESCQCPRLPGLPGRGRAPTSQQAWGCLLPGTRIGRGDSDCGGGVVVVLEGCDTEDCSGAQRGPGVGVVAVAPGGFRGGV